MTVHYDKQCRVANWRESLALYIGELKAKSGLSFDQIAELTKRYGAGVSKTTIWNIVNETNKDVEIGTLLTLAKVFGVKERDILNHIFELPQKEATNTHEEVVAIAYIRSMPLEIRADAVAILETLWRRHSNGAIKIPVYKAEDEKKHDQRKKKSG